MVLGDYIEDRYVFGTATRLCPEAPVPVIVPQSEKITAGGMGLVDLQLREFGADVLFFAGSKSIKKRIFAGNHLICRIDEDSTYITPCAPHEYHLDQVGAIVVSDYGKGAITQELARKIVETGKPCFVDAKFHWHWFEGKNVTIFPNNHEATPIVELPAGSYKSCEFGRVVSKMGKDGCRLNDAEHKDLVIPATVSEVVDSCGAGDCFLSGFVFAWSKGNDAKYCLRFANAIAGESCKHVGTYVVPKEFANAWEQREQMEQDARRKTAAESCH